MYEKSYLITIAYQRVDEEDYIVFLRCLYEHGECMFIYLEGKYNSLKEIKLS
jgi:hypothetical protein